MRVMFDSKTKFLQIRHYCYMAFIVFFSFSIEKFRFTVIELIPLPHDKFLPNFAA